ncbi:lipopolysaccharide biosynthesis protein [Photobacterium sp. CCB-ST2H9]|uniref:lipopolysaccharide biosynthesis protein n=1 Tax=Photobacterium sp. CCB-ST2H9 TaxID=2912855 RepID=UPI002003BD86|nr:lipopolysaccharide biosynthesis protein [Photobacterium sp. CCB-ST2H9]UTM56561.1 lipopolysaccharide biosynthesis protein [Photobacterium sp. CCB-ST2H9]
MSKIKRKTVTSLKWSAIERLATQIVQLIVMLILASTLGPEAFGLVGMLAVFISISQVFVDSGMSSALIRKQDVSEKDFATAFYFNIAISIVSYAVLITVSPVIANFYRQPELEMLSIMLGSVVVINSFAIVQRAKLSIKMDFKTQAKASLLAVSLSSLTSLSMAYMDMGVWALVAQNLIYAFANVLFLNVFNPWWPGCKFSKSSFKDLFGFGSKLLAAGLIDSFYQNIYQIVIGRQFSAYSVGQFTQANQLVKTPASTITMVIQRVTYPMLSGIQNDKQRLESAYLLTIRLAATVIFPLLFGLSSVSTPMLPLLLGQEWIPAATFVSILCFGFVLYPIHAINLNYLQVKGRSDIYLKLEVIKKIIITVTLIISIQYGITAVCIGIALQSHLGLFINTYYNGRVSGLGIRNQLKILVPIWLISLVSCIIAKLFGGLIFEDGWGVVITTVIFSTLIYISSIRFFQPDLYRYIYSAILTKKEYQTR